MKDNKKLREVIDWNPRDLKPLSSVIEEKIIPKGRRPRRRIGDTTANVGSKLY